MSLNTMRKLLLNILIIQFAAFAAIAQPRTKFTIVKSDTIFFDPEKHPFSEEGPALYVSWISNHTNQKLKSHDEETPKKVYLSFVVDERGQLSDFKIEKGAGDAYDSEAIRLVKKHPHKWTPGRCGTRNVKTRMTLPVFFESCRGVEYEIRSSSLRSVNCDYSTPSAL
jgi:hypothetical protein